MSKTLVLKPRQPIQDANGEIIYRWHDYFPVANFFTNAVRGQSYMKAAMLHTLAGAIQLEVEVAEFGKPIPLDGQHVVVEVDGKLERVARFRQHMPEIVVEIPNKFVRPLWKRMIEAKAEQFNNGDNPLPDGPFALMMADFAQQLGQELPDPRVEEDEGEEEKAECDS